jgi:hypothetical protein
LSGTKLPDLADTAPEASKPDSAPKASAKLRKWAGHANYAWKSISLGILGAVLALYALNLLFLDRNLNLALIGVPDALRSAGFTSAVATQRMEDAINGIEDQANTARSAYAAISDQDQLNVTIPGVGITFQGLTATLRYFFHISERQITGEFILSNNQLSLQLRLNGRTIYYRSVPGSDADAANALIYDGERGGAFRIVQVTQPYIAASALDSWGEDDKAALAANDILNTKSVSASDIAYSYNLRGLIAYKAALITGNAALIPAAMADFAQAGDIAIAHDNLGNLYDIPGASWRSQDAAMAQFNAALSITPQDSRAYNGLGNLYREEADAEKNPADAQTDFTAAISNYEAALRWDQKYASPYAGLAHIYADPLFQGRNAKRAAQAEAQKLYLGITMMTDKADMFERFAAYSDDPARKAFWLGKACTQLISAQAASRESDGAGLPGVDLMQESLGTRIEAVNTALDGQAGCPPVPPK